jgi:hypothetical protein
MHGCEVAKELLVADDGEASLAIRVLSIALLLASMDRIGTSVVACHSRTHCGFSAAGTMSNPRAARPVLNSAWHAATAWVVLPSPMSSASKSRSSSKKRRTPSSW